MSKCKATKNRQKKPRRSSGAQAVVTLSLLAAAQVPGTAWALDLNCNRKLQFGTVIACAAAAGTVTVDPQGNASSAPGCLSVTGLPDGGGCTLSIDTSSPVVITIVANDTIADGANNMMVNNFLLQSSSAGPAATITTPTTGQVSLRVGGTLNVTAGQAGGTYSGSATITANYQ